MKFNLASLILCTSVAAQAAANGDVLPTAVAVEFVQALQNQDFEQAAAMLSDDRSSRKATIPVLQRINDCVGGFATMRPIPTLPDGKSLGLEFPAHRTAQPNVRKFFQVSYAATASDGTPVFFSLNIADDKALPHILSLGVHFPVFDAQSTKRATDLRNYINQRN